MNIKEDPSIIKQGYYYLVEIKWEECPEKLFINEYGNEPAAKKATEHWNKFPTAKATYRKVML